MWNRRTVLLLSVCLVAVVGLLVTLLGRGAVVAAEPDLRTVFEQRYQAWQDYIRQPEFGGGSRLQPYVDNPAFKEIVGLGVPALPLIMRRVEEERGLVYGCMSVAASRIIKRTWKRGEVIRIWWGKGRFDVPKEFDGHFSGWQEAVARHDSQKAAATLTDLEGIGVLVLPQMVEKVAAGKSELIPAISRLTDGAVKADATAEQVAAWWAKDKAHWLLPEEPSPPAPQ